MTHMLGVELTRLTPRNCDELLFDDVLWADAPLAHGHDVLICHGNGPQVGMLAVESGIDSALTLPYPLDDLVAQPRARSAIGLAQSLHNAGVNGAPARTKASD